MEEYTDLESFSIEELRELKSNLEKANISDSLVLINNSRAENENMALKERIKKLEDIIGEYMIKIDKKIDVASIIKTEDIIFTTKSVIKSNETVDGLLRIKELKGTGQIDQILLISDLNTYNFYILIDDNILFNKNYTYFFDNSKYLDGISAFLDDGYYTLSIRNLQFKKSFSISLTTPASTVFSEIMVKYTIRDEVSISS